MHLNQEETQATKQLIRSLVDQVDGYERKWAMNLSRESQLSVYFRPSATVQWEDHSVGLSGCIMEGTAALGRVEELFQQISTRHQYLYYAQLDGTVPFRVRSAGDGSVSALSSVTAARLSSVGGFGAAVVRQSADGDATVRLDDSAARRSLQSPNRSPRQASGGRAGSDRGGSGSRRASGGRRTADRASSSAGGRESAARTAGSYETLPSVVSAAGSETAATEPPGSSGYTADVSASLETATVTSAPTSAHKKSDKRRNDKKKQAMTLSKMEEADVIVFLFGNVERPTKADNFIQKVQRKILKVLHETREAAGVFYFHKGSRAVNRPDLLPATYDELLDTLFARFQAYYTESARYQLACFAEFCDEFVEFVQLAARLPGLLFRHQSELYCRQVASVTRSYITQLSEERRRWTATAADLDHRLRPGLGHPSQHPRLFTLVELTVDLKEAHVSRLRELDTSCAAARTELQTEFEHSSAFVTDRCRSALRALTGGAAHLSAAGLEALTEVVTAAVEEPREACQRAWGTQRGEAERSWRQAVQGAATECWRWTDNWFRGVESVQQLYRLCEHV